MGRLLQVALALSLLLNAFFIGGFLFRGWVGPLPFESRLLPPPPPPPPGSRPSPLEMVARDIDLDDGQRQALRGTFEQYTHARRERFREIQKLREQIIAEYKRSPLDQAGIEALLDKLGDLRADQQKETVRALIQMEGQLRPDQRQQLHEVLVERFSPPPRSLGPPLARPSQ